MAVVNQLEFNLGYGTPLSSVQAGGSSEKQGAKGDAWSADFLHQAGPNVYFGLGGGQFRSHDHVSETFASNALSTITSKTTTIFFLTRTDLGPPARMVPYLIAGIGWVKNTLSVTATPSTTWSNTGTSEQRTFLNDSLDTVGYASGIGLDYPISDRLYFGIEARYQGSLKRTYTLNSEGQTATGQSNIQTPVNVFLLGLKAGIKY